MIASVVRRFMNFGTNLSIRNYILVDDTFIMMLFLREYKIRSGVNEFRRIL